MAAAKPMVIVNGDYRPPRKDAPAFSFVPAGYYNCLIRAGAIPVIIPPLADEDDINRILDQVERRSYAEGPTWDTRRRRVHDSSGHAAIGFRREKFDRLLVQLVAERKMPVMGVGSGLQLLNVSQGGNLFFHIPEDFPRALPHCDPIDPNHRHALVVERGTLMERVYGEGEIRVNSRHHMAIDEVAPGFAVTARCPDGVIEAIESTRDDWFAFGTQFHPESDSASALDLRIFEEFIAGITGEVIEEARMVA